MYLFTRMKSPTSSVGTIDPDGILNGSTRNERSTKTINITGKKLFPYSTHQGSFAPAARRPASQRRSARATAPVTTSSENSSSAKFMAEIAPSECVYIPGHELRHSPCSHPLDAGALLVGSCCYLLSTRS